MIFSFLAFATILPPLFNFFRPLLQQYYYTTFA
jgi:hypothetical protein